MKEVLEKVFNEFLIEKEKPVKGNELYSYLFNGKCATSFYDSKVIDKNQYEIHSSGGKGNWGIIPWIGVFDKDISTTARKGYYIVYLFSADMTRVYLSLNQGCAYSGKTAHPFQKNGAPFRLKLSNAQLVN